MPALAPVASFPVASLAGPSGNYYPLAGGIVFQGANVLPNQLQVTAGQLTFAGATLTPVTAPPRVTWTGLEVAHPGNAAWRVTWSAIEVLRSTAVIPTEWVVSWIGVEALHVGAAADRVTWMGAEVAHIGQAMARLTWMGVEVLRSLADMPPDTGFVYLICG